MFYKCILFLFVSLYFTIFGQKLVRKVKYHEPLVDHLHFTDKLVPYYYLNDYVVKFFIVIGLFFFSRSQISEFIVLYSILLTIRTISFMLTILPHCQPITFPKKNYNTSISKIMWNYITCTDTHFGSQGDLFPSGHTLFTTLFSMMISYYNIFPKIVEYFIWGISICSSILLILSKCHYSIDVLYGYILTVFVFQNYHHLLK